jgi:hypothetical protein
MPNSLDVQVLNSEGEPVEGAEVKVYVHDDLLHAATKGPGGFLDEASTDSEGHAEFETEGEYEDSRPIDIYVDGQLIDTYTIGGVPTP